MQSPEQVVLVDRSGVELGVEDRTDAHLRGLLHRAVSVFVLNGAGELLLQRRASSKALFAGRWANTCCTHGRSGETVLETGERRLVEEMGMHVSLSELGVFVYRATDPVSGLTEHEFDHVLVGVSTAEPSPHPAEVDGTRWVSLVALRESVDGPAYAPWLGEALRAFPDLGSHHSG